MAGEDGKGSLRNTVCNYKYNAGFAQAISSLKNQGSFSVHSSRADQWRCQGILTWCRYSVIADYVQAANVFS